MLTTSKAIMTESNSINQRFNTRDFKDKRFYGYGLYVKKNVMFLLLTSNVKTKFK